MRWQGREGGRVGCRVSYGLFVRGALAYVIFDCVC